MKPDEALKQSIVRKLEVAARTVALGLFTAGLAAGCASAPRSNSQFDYAGEKVQIEQRLQEILHAAETKEFDRLEGYHLYGPKFTKFTSASAVRLDAEAGRKGERDGLGGAKNLKMNIQNLKIDVFGDAAIATFILEYSFDSGTETVRRKERSTLVFVKAAGEWRIAHEHLSRINP